MTETLLGFQQEKMIELKLDINDGLILRWFVELQKKGKILKYLSQEETYYLVNYEEFVKDYPVIKLSYLTIGNRMRRMAELGILKHFTVKKGGTLNYYKLGDNYNCLTRKNYKKLLVRKPGMKKQLIISLV